MNRWANYGRRRRLLAPLKDPANSKLRRNGLQLDHVYNMGVIFGILYILILYE